MIKQFTFPANKASEGFTVDVNVRNWCSDPEFLDLKLDSWGNLVLWRNNSVNYVDHLTQQNKHIQSYCILGMARSSFPQCCGLDIVWYMPSALTVSWPVDVCEKWWKWVGGLTPIVGPAIGIIPRNLNFDNSIGSDIGMDYTWIAKKGVPFGKPFKNIRYTNHVLVPYLFFQHPGIDQVINPQYGLLT